MVLTHGPEQILYLSNLEDGSPILSQSTFANINAKAKPFFSVQFSIDETRKNQDDVFVARFASFDPRTVSPGAKTLRNAAGTANSLLCALIPGLEATVVYFQSVFETLSSEGDGQGYGRT